MKWYDKYLQIYNHPFSEVRADIRQTISQGYGKANAEKPVVSVIAIAHNESERILACLWSLIDNECKYPKELLIVDDDSDDGMAEELASLGIKTVFEKRRSPGFARQAGLDAAKGKYCVCVDADTIYPPHYIETMVDAVVPDKYSCAYGLWSFLTDDQISPLQIKVYEMMRDVYLYIQHLRRPELNVRGMVFSFKTDLARKYGFRNDIIRGEDGTLALNLKQDGKIRFVRSRKVRPVTSNSILKVQGTSLWDEVVHRIKKGTRGLTGLFVSAKKYKDKEDNMISPKQC